MLEAYVQERGYVSVSQFWFLFSCSSRVLSSSTVSFLRHGLCAGRQYSHCFDTTALCS